MGHVVLKDVTKRFGSQVALGGVDVSVDKGEMLALLGPSGCGKTTLLRCVAGLAEADAGTISIGGTDVTHAPARKRPIGMVFQSYALFPNLPVRGNIGFPLSVRRRPKQEVRERVTELLELTGLEPYADRLPNQLSGGQQQRVALARALAPRPEVLLLDEPLSALDAQVRSRLRDEVRRIQNQVGITTIFVTHDQSEALAISDRVAVMNSGQIEQCAPPPEIYATPATRFAAGFVGNRNSLEIPVQDGKVAWGEAFTAAAPDAATERALCLFRPEDVTVTAGGPGLAGTVDVKVFLGAVTRVYVTADGVTVFADIPSRQAAELETGQRVQVRVSPDHIQVFPT